MFLSFPLIPFTLFTISILALITFYLALKIKLPVCFREIFLFTIAFTFLNSAYSFIIEVYYPTMSWRDKTVPFILIYGPLLHFGIIALRDQKISFWSLLLHALPCLYYLVWFIGLMTGLINNSVELLDSIIRQLYTLSPISFIAYAFSTVITGRNVFKNHIKDKLLIFVFGRILLVFLAMLFLMMTISKNLTNNSVAINLLRMLIYGCLLIYLIVLFNFTVKKLVIGSHAANDEEEEVMPEEFNENARYEKSALTKEQLLAYHAKLDKAMQKDKIFLDATLSLSSLASYLKIPNHHVTQVLSVTIQKTFYQYVNGFRIAYACKLLAAEKGEMNFDELAEKSGFNSKPSFNRQFKTIMNYTPSEYRNKLAEPVS
ncbi:MAG: AraC family transcriptional regulator [Pedobacter sp.]|nr:MAG: AraC family transcriptional regulator [Pedobacter sp.]